MRRFHRVAGPFTIRLHILFKSCVDDEAQQQQHQHSAGNVSKDNEACWPAPLALQDPSSAKGPATSSAAVGACYAFIAVSALQVHVAGAVCGVSAVQRTCGGGRGEGGGVL